MNSYIDPILTEYRTNKEAADFASLFITEQTDIKEILDNEKTKEEIEADYTLGELQDIAKYLSTELEFVDHTGIA
jgi:hypothetical protein